MKKIISDEYLKEQEILHADTKKKYGVESTRRAPEVALIAKKLGCKSILDYGAGKQRLKSSLNYYGYKGKYTAYDPAITEIKNIPKGFYDLLVSIDVLEHIEPDFLDNVLDEMKENLSVYGFFTISTVPAGKVLSDGRNAHLIQEEFDWWKPKIEFRWDIIGTPTKDRNTIKVIVRKKWTS